MLPDDMTRLPKPVTQNKRERDVFRLYGSCFQGLPRIQLDSSSEACTLPQGYNGQASQDSALMAFAQLAAIRLGATRAMISLMDREQQHILAEATPSMSIRFGSQTGQPNNLWLGSVSIPIGWAICSRILDLDPESMTRSADAAVIINDLSNDELYQNRTYVKDEPHARFYAGVPLTSPAGAIVGALCVYDGKPRNGLSEQDIRYLQDLGATITEHLDTYTLKQQYRRGEQLTRGLISFSEGASALRPFKDDSISVQSSTMSPAISSQDSSSSPKWSQDLVSSFSNDTRVSTIASSLGPLAPRHPSTRSQDPSGHYSSVRALQDSILPTSSKTMFARAAHIMRASSDLDGVIILDASVAATRQRHHGGGDGDTESGSEDESAADSSFSPTSSSESESVHRHFDKTLPRSSKNTKKTCQILGFSTKDGSGIAGDIADPEHRSFLEKDLTRLFRKFPNGKILQFDAQGEPTSSAEESDPISSSQELSSPTEEQGPWRPGAGRMKGPGRFFDAVSAMLPQARSVAFVPFWDFERSRWFAGCLCYSTRNDRILTSQLDLAYFKIFSNSIMSEIARLDAMASSQAKTTFVASISHELRSPLHGILGTLQFLQESRLDSFQVTMLNSMAACGQTLLDTLNHVLDYAKINQARRSVATKRLKDSNTVRLASKPLKSRKSGSSPSHPALDLGLASEEVVEAVFAGQTHVAITGNQADASWSPSETSRASTPQNSDVDELRHRKDCYIILDIDYAEDWHFCLEPGSFRRVLMNIFGNALKYTDSGHIKVSLRLGDRRNGRSQVIMTVTDSGSGMSPAFLANQVFAPFSQENPHSPGTGLGLSIVRQIVETVGGKIEITSDTSKGTKLTVRFVLLTSENRLPEPPQRAQFIEAQERLKGRRICILHNKPLDANDTDIPQNYEGLDLFSDTLAKTLKNWLDIDVIHTNSWESNDADIIICPEVSFDYLAAIRQRREKDEKAPVTIFVAMDSLEAATLRQDARVVSKESVVEIMTQPCGPYKLATILSSCLQRFDSPDENVRIEQIPDAEDFLTPLETTSPPNEGATIDPPLLEHPVDFSGMRQMSSLRTNTLDNSATGETKWNPTVTVIETDPRAVSPGSTGVISPPSGADPATLGASHTPGTQASASSERLNPKIPIREKLKSRMSRVLITDDNAINRKLLVAFLTKLNIQYEVAENGLEALQKYQQSSVRYDAILMDISMPVMDGMTATRRIREYEQKHNVDRTFVAALTGLASASARLEAWNSGIDHFMTKPLNFKALEQVLEKASNDRSSVQEKMEKPAKS